MGGMQKVSTNQSGYRAELQRFDDYIARGYLDYSDTLFDSIDQYLSQLPMNSLERAEGNKLRKALISNLYKKSSAKNVPQAELTKIFIKMSQKI